jgi:hypothetical protein
MPEIAANTKYYIQSMNFLHVYIYDKVYKLGNSNSHKIEHPNSVL